MNRAVLIVVMSILMVGATHPAFGMENSLASRDGAAARAGASVSNLVQGPVSDAEDGSVVSAQVTRPVRITLSPDTTYQTIVGWEATSQAGQTDSPKFLDYRDYLFDEAVYDLGITRLRVEVFPNTDESGFDFVALDDRIESTVLPLKQRIDARGDRLWLNICYVHRKLPESSRLLMPDVYAQNVLATYQHLQARYGLVPDSWEQLEPDTFHWGDPTRLAHAIRATGDLLTANGYTPYIVGPSTSRAYLTLSWVAGIKALPGAYQYIRELSYHRYDNPQPAAIRQIGELARRDGLATSMLEHIGSSYQDLHTDLKLGNVSAWQQYTLAFPGVQGDNGGHYYWVDNTATGPETQIVLRSRTKFLRQYFRYIRPGAVRIGATSSDGGFDPVAFINPRGDYVVVVAASTGGSFDVQGLTPGTYSTTYTTAYEAAVGGPDQVVSSSESVTGMLPLQGVLTITARP